MHNTFLLKNKYFHSTQIFDVLSDKCFRLRDAF